MTRPASPRGERLLPLAVAAPLLVLLLAARPLLAADAAAPAAAGPVCSASASAAPDMPDPGSPAFAEWMVQRYRALARPAPAPAAPVAARAPRMLAY
ncbi:MAG: hypothetical protein HY855_05790 [Burkholderiales bacterium]|nr:hypothetical protein [Burkholderiales bacterium]